MRPNETVLKVSSLLATPDEANQGQGGLIPTSTVGVNRAKQGQMGPGFTPPRRSRADGNPLALSERVRVPLPPRHRLREE